MTPELNVDILGVLRVVGFSLVLYLRTVCPSSFLYIQYHYGLWFPQLSLSIHQYICFALINQLESSVFFSAMASTYVKPFLI